MVQAISGQKPQAPSVETNEDTLRFDDVIKAARAGTTDQTSAGKQPPHKDSQPTKADLAKARDGQVTYTVQPGDNLTNVATRFGLSLTDIKAADPKFFPPGGNPNLIFSGEHLLVLNKTLSENAEAMAKTKDPATLKGLIAFDLLYTTRGLQTPGDQLSAQEKILIARRGNDPAFATLVKGEGQTLTQLWTAQGRTHAIWDPLNKFASKHDWNGLKGEINSQIETLTATSPAVDAVNNYKTMLLTYGSHNPQFTAAVNQAVHKFLVTDPAAAAKEVAQIYNEGGPLAGVAASQKLADLTNPQTVNPLTAVLIAQQSSPTILKITAALVTGHGIVNGAAPPGAFQTYNNLSAVADGIDRSPAGTTVINQMANVLRNADPTRFDVQYAVTHGSGVVLPLAIAAQLSQHGDKAQANQFVAATTAGIVDLKQQIRDDVGKLGTDASLLLGPGGNWNALLAGSNQPFKTPSALSFFNSHPTQLKAIKADMTTLNVDGYELERAIAGVNEYAPKLTGLRDHGQLVNQAKMPDPKQDPKLSMALAVSAAGLQDGLRGLNLTLAGTESTQAALSKIVPDLSWPSRMARNQVLADIKLATGTRPTNIGLSLFGTGTYLWGVYDQGAALSADIKQDGWEKGLFSSDNGWRNAGFLGMYALGTVIEGGQVFSQAATNLLGLTAADTGWKGMLASAATGLKSGQTDPLTGVSGNAWGDLFSNQLKWFGWWNLIGTANYALEGNFPKAGALGTATLGTFISQYPGVASALGIGRLGAVLGLDDPLALASPIGAALTLIGSAAIFWLNAHERAELAAKSEPFNRDYLIAAGVKPDIATALAQNDSNGVGVAPRLTALAKYQGISPNALLQWLNQQPPSFVQNLVTHGLLPLQPDAQGNYLPRVSKASWNSAGQYRGDFYLFPAPDPRGISPTDPRYWDRASIIEAQSLEGVRIVAKEFGHPLPGNDAVSLPPLEVSIPPAIG
jgi:LysM repeat protein